MATDLEDMSQADKREALTIIFALAGGSQYFERLRPDHTEPSPVYRVLKSLIIKAGLKVEEVSGDPALHGLNNNVMDQVFFDTIRRLNIDNGFVQTEQAASYLNGKLIRYLIQKVVT